MQIEPSHQSALDFDLACTVRLLRHDNTRDFKRLQSLIRSLAVLATGMLGGNTRKLLDSYASPENDSDKPLDDDDPDVL